MYVPLFLLFLCKDYIKKIYIKRITHIKGFRNKAGTEEQILDLGVLGVIGVLNTPVSKFLVFNFRGPVRCGKKKRTSEPG